MSARKDREEVARKLLVYSRALPKGLIGSGKGSTESETAVLYYLANKNEKDEVIPSEIASEFGYSRTRVTRVLDALEGRGEIRRVHDKQDRRRVLVYATEKGRKASRDNDAKATEGLMKFIDTLGEDDANELIRILRKSYQENYSSHSPDDLNV